jgi:hypothetical protein
VVSCSRSWPGSRWRTAPRWASGADRLELGQLTGRALKNTAIHQFGSSDDTTDRAVAEWIVEAPPGTTVDVEVRHQRAGVVTTTVTLA